MNAIQRWLSVSQNTQGIHVLYHSAITRAIINSDIQLTEQLLDHADRHKVLLSRETYQKAAEFFKEHGRPDKYNVRALRLAHVPLLIHNRSESHQKTTGQIISGTSYYIIYA